MISSYVITANEWTPITTAGQSGTCWLNESGDAGKGVQDIRVFPAISMPSDDDIYKAKRVYKPSGNHDVLSFDGNGTSEILYARAFSEGSTATIHVSVN